MNDSMNKKLRNFDIIRCFNNMMDTKEEFSYGNTELCAMVFELFSDKFKEEIKYRLIENWISVYFNVSTMHRTERSFRECMEELICLLVLTDGEELMPKNYQFGMAGYLRDLGEKCIREESGEWCLTDKWSFPDRKEYEILRHYNMRLEEKMDFMRLQEIYNSKNLSAIQHYMDKRPTEEIKTLIDNYIFSTGSSEEISILNCMHFVHNYEGYSLQAVVRRGGVFMGTLFEEFIEDPGLYIICGKKGKGKTVLSLNILEDRVNSDDESNVLYFYSTPLTENQTSRFDNARICFANISNPFNGALEFIYREARWMKEVHSLEMIVIDDFYELLKWTRFRNPYPKKKEQISYLLTSLKALAQIYQVPIVLIEDCEKLIEAKNDKHPQPVDLYLNKTVKTYVDMFILMNLEDSDDTGTDLKGLTRFRICDFNTAEEYEYQLIYDTDKMRYR